MKRTMRMMAVMMILTALLCGCSIMNPMTQARKHSKAAQEAMSAGNYDKAISEFKALLAVSPDDPNALSGITQAYENKGDYEKAIESFKTLMEKVPSKGQNESLAALYIKKGDGTSAITILMNELAAKPDSVVINRLLGEAHLANKNENDALRYLLLSLLYDSSCSFDFTRAKSDQPYFMAFQYLPIAFGSFKTPEKSDEVMKKVKEIIVKTNAVKEEGTKEGGLPAALFADKMIKAGESIGSLKIGATVQSIKKECSTSQPLPADKMLLYSQDKYKVFAIINAEGSIIQLNCRDMRFMTDKKINMEISSAGDVIAAYGEEYEVYPAPPDVKAHYKLVYPNSGIGFTITGDKVSDIFVRKSFPETSQLSPSTDSSPGGEASPQPTGTPDTAPSPEASSSPGESSASESTESPQTDATASPQSSGTP